MDGLFFGRVTAKIVWTFHFYGKKPI